MPRDRSPSACVTGLALRPAAGEAPREVREVSVSSDGTLEGDHGSSARRGITLVSQTVWETACREVGASLPWTARRANVCVEGVDLPGLIGKRVRIGELVVEILGETKPCQRMEQAWPGLERALESDGRGGVYGRIVEGRALAVGDAIEVTDDGGREDG